MQAFEKQTGRHGGGPSAAGAGLLATHLDEPLLQHLVLPLQVLELLLRDF